MSERKSKKKIIALVVAIVFALAVIGALAFEAVYLIKLENRNAKIEEFIKKNYDVSIDEWDGEKKAFTEEELVQSLSDAIDDELGVYVTGKDIKEFVSNLIEKMQGEYLEIHEIYDDTAVVEAYKSGDDSGLSDEDKFTLEKVTEVIDEIIKDDMTDYEKEFAVYTWLVKYVNYDEESFSAIPDNIEDYNYYPYGVLKYHSAICVGNATTFKLFMDILGIDCKIIHSTEEGEHAWNMVCLDGDWYHVDVTFDSGMNGEPGYEYFNVPDCFKEDGGFPWDRDEFPVADSIKYTYILQDAKEIKSITELPQLIKDAFDEKAVTLVVKSEEYLSEFERVVDEIAMRLDGNSYIYVSMETAMPDYCIYVITLETLEYDEPVYPEDPEYEDGEDGFIEWDMTLELIEKLFKEE